MKITPDDPMIRDLQEGLTECSKILGGKHPAIQGAILADLLSIHIIGYQDEDVRKDILREIVVMVEALIPVNEELLRDDIDKAKMQ